MFDDMVNLFNLGAFSDEEKELLRTDFTYKKQMSRLLKEARQAAKRDTCYFAERALQVFVIRIPFRGFVLKTLPQMAMH